MISTAESLKHSDRNFGQKPAEFSYECPRTDLNKMSLPRPNQQEFKSPHWVPLDRFFKNWLLLIQKQFYSNYTQLILLIKKFLMCRILIWKWHYSILVFQPLEMVTLGLR